MMHVLTHSQRTRQRKKLRIFHAGCRHQANTINDLQSKFEYLTQQFDHMSHCMKDLTVVHGAPPGVGAASVSLSATVMPSPALSYSRDFLLSLRSELQSKSKLPAGHQSSYTQLHMSQTPAQVQPHDQTHVQTHDQSQEQEVEQEHEEEEDICPDMSRSTDTEATRLRYNTQVTGPITFNQYYALSNDDILMPAIYGIPRAPRGPHLSIAQALDMIKQAKLNVPCLCDCPPRHVSNPDNDLAIIEWMPLDHKKHR